MNDMVTVHIKTPQNEILEGSLLPLDYSIQMVIDELIDSLDLPRLDESTRPLNYKICSAQQERTLANHETINSAKINNGDTLEIRLSDENNNGFVPGMTGNISDGNIYEPPPTMQMPNTSEINVVLSVMDLNRHETIILPVTRPVGDLIRQIIGNYGLPARDNLNQIIKYKLQSKALGRFLDERMTLLEAQIPPLDRLTLHRDEIAG
jgi:uncharacterized ubiquitin-like protein YukD